MALSLSQVKERASSLKGEDVEVQLSTCRLDYKDDKLIMSAGQKGEFEVTDTGKESIMRVLHMPKAYYNRCPKDWLDKHGEFWMAQAEGIAMLRLNPAGKLRGVVPADVPVFDTIDIVRTLESFASAPEVEFDLAEVSDGHSHLRLYDKRRTVKLSHTDPLYSGVMIQNSDIGFVPLKVSPMIYRVICTNGLVSTMGDLGNYAYKGHNRLEVHQARARIEGYLSNSLKYLENYSESIKQMHGAELNPVQEERAWAVLEDLKGSTGAIVSLAKTEYADAGEKTQWGFLNSITRASQQLAPRQRISADKFAGAILAKKDVFFSRSQE